MLIHLSSLVLFAQVLDALIGTAGQQADTGDSSTSVLRSTSITLAAAWPAPLRATSPSSSPQSDVLATTSSKRRRVSPASPVPNAKLGLWSGEFQLCCFLYSDDEKGLREWKDPPLPQKWHTGEEVREVGKGKLFVKESCILEPLVAELQAVGVQDLRISKLDEEELKERGKANELYETGITISFPLPRCRIELWKAKDGGSHSCSVIGDCIDSLDIAVTALMILGPVSLDGSLMLETPTCE